MWFLQALIAWIDYKQHKKKKRAGYIIISFYYMELLCLEKDMFREINCQKSTGFYYPDLIDQWYDIIIFFGCCTDFDCYSAWEALKFQVCILSCVSVWTLALSISILGHQKLWNAEILPVDSCWNKYSCNSVGDWSLNGQASVCFWEDLLF